MSTVEFFTEGNTFSGEVLFVNAGRGNAYLKEHTCVVFWGPEVLPIAKAKIYRRQTDACKMQHPTTDSVNGVLTPDAPIMRPGESADPCERSYGKMLSGAGSKLCPGQMSKSD